MNVNPEFVTGLVTGIILMFLVGKILGWSFKMYTFKYICPHYRSCGFSVRSNDATTQYEIVTNHKKFHQSNDAQV